MNVFPEVKKNFGFGCMRLPMNGEEVDLAEFSKMIDIPLHASESITTYPTDEIFLKYGARKEKPNAIRNIIAKLPIDCCKTTAYIREK